jgi:UDP-glucuronate decarboxylase
MKSLRLSQDYLQDILDAMEKAEEFIGTISFHEFIDDPTQRQPDITLAREKLDWEPKIQLEEGLRKTIPYFKELLRK